MSTAKAYLKTVPEKYSKQFIDGLNQSVIDWAYMEQSKEETKEYEVEFIGL